MAERDPIPAIGEAIVAAGPSYGLFRYQRHIGIIDIDFIAATRLRKGCFYIGLPPVIPAEVHGYRPPAVAPINGIIKRFPVIGKEKMVVVAGRHGKGVEDTIEQLNEENAGTIVSK